MTSEQKGVLPSVDIKLDSSDLTSASRVTDTSNMSDWNSNGLQEASEETDTKKTVKEEEIEETLMCAIADQGLEDRNVKEENTKLDKAAFDKAMLDLIGPEIAASEKLITVKYLESIRICVNRVGQALGSRDSTKIAAITQENWNGIRYFLWNVSQISKMKPEIRGDPVRLKATLEFIIKPEQGFPEQWRKVAGYIYSMFEDRNWDEPVKSDNAKNKKRGLEHRDGEAAKKQKSGSTDKGLVKKPPQNHPIFGKNGPMHHILCSRGKQLSMSIDDTYKSKNARVYGSNGLQVGNWWARLLAALRDGAHGERIAGVAGDPLFGACSIVVNGGGYDGIDRDLGDTIIYSSSGAFETKAKTADQQNRSAKCLLRSFETRKPVRVLRGDSKWKYAPRVGYRYDGLYEVVEKGTGRNKEGGAYIWVKLVRLANQDPIDTKKPTASQVNQEAAVKLGY